MARHFRLAKVLDARRVVEDRRKQELAAAERVLVRERIVLERLHGKIATHRAQALAPPEGRLDVRRETALRAILQQLAEEARRQETVVGQCEKRFEAHRAALVKAARDRKVLENLEERATLAERREDDAREQVEMDEIARQTFVRGSRNAVGARRAGHSGEEKP
jgi:flagellar export protein FliJ